ncbi:MAG TPA: peptidylprolyl isomerase [Clostridia bacterium]|nr:peptidylprolyl isomerase [Clostridia bacterium]
MTKKISRAIAVLCTLAITFTLCSCSDTSWSIKVNNEKVPAGMYIYFLLSVSSSIKNNATSSDPWSQKIENQDAITYAKDQAVKYASEFVIIENLCKKEKITLTSSEKSAADSQGQQTYSGSSSTFTNNGISQASINRITEDYSLANKLYTKYYGDKGTKTITDEALKKYEADYICVKHIFFSDKDDSSNKLTGAALTAVTKKVNDVLAQVQKDPSKFDELMKKYTQDSGGLQQYPNGYTFKKDSTQYVKEFVSGANSMKVGEIKLITSSYGYHIMHRIDLDKTTMKTQYGQELFQKLIDNEVSKAKIVRNQTTINAYNPKTLKS